ncbi:MAG: amidase [Sphingomonadales bacterium]
MTDESTNNNEEKFETSRRTFLTSGVSGVAVLGAGLVASSCGQTQEGPKDKEPGFLGGTSDSTHNINLEDLKSAEKIMGINYSHEERTQMLNTIDNQIDNMLTLRSLDHSNDLMPATVFDPRLPGKSYGAQENLVSLREINIPSLPLSEEVIAFSPLVHLAHWIKSKQITSLQLTELYLKRIKAIDPKLECFVTVTAELARKQATMADSEITSGNYRGPLHGIPYGVKDLMDADGTPTTWGAMPYKDRVATRNSAVVEKLKEAGAVLIGKTTCGALAYGDIWWGGVTRNPWSLGEGSSGSSAGSGSSTAGGLVGFSIGTETLGSIISPSARCGATGLRPTFGRVSRFGGMSLCPSLDKLGPICRSVEDTALVLSAINGQDDRDPSSMSHGFNYDGNMDIKSLRVGYNQAWFGDNASDVDRACLAAAKKLGLNLVEIEIPEMPINSLIPILSAEASAMFEQLTLTNKDDLMRWQSSRAWPNSFRETRFFSAVDLINADRFRRKIMIMMDKIFESVDAIIGPNSVNGLLTITNYTGQPQLSFKAGFVDRNISPAFGTEPETSPTPKRVTQNFSVWGPLFGENNAIAIGRALESEMNMRDKNPTL